ncbi:hypothetical protein PoB_000692100 [Plakobranchus ocellatus]|uniref:Uncharacterized protein n=1 Tax=Plakobranchus ocellatus TaxID=259542 RepID=A0AAV3YB68_9GAST|nr:hypothetical protein PoB_000692100 [Plakobranchus ocellatus]
MRNNLVKGIAGSEILLDLHGDPKRDRFLEEMVTFLAQKEQGKATNSAVGDCSASINHTSTSAPPVQHKVKCWTVGNLVMVPEMIGTLKHDIVEPGPSNICQMLSKRPLHILLQQMHILWHLGSQGQGQVVQILPTRQTVFKLHLRLKTASLTRPLRPIMILQVMFPINYVAFSLPKN